MKNLQKGFTLAEIIITAGIISVIAFMGFTATKKSTEKAYNLYIYNAYKSVCAAIADAAADGKVLNPQTSAGAIEDDEAAKHICNLLTKPNKAPYTDTYGNYTADCLNKTKIGMNKVLSSKYIKFRIEVPTAKYLTSSGEVKETRVLRFKYVPDFHLLIPIRENNSDIDLATRKDLLPFYIEQEDVFNDGTGTYKRSRKVYKSFLDTACSNKDIDKTIIESDTNLSCEGIPRTTEGIMKVGDPRNI